MAKNDILKRLNKVFAPKVDFSAVDSELAKLKNSLTETVNIQTLEDVSRKLKQFQSKIDFSSILKELENVKGIVDQNIKELSKNIKEKNSELDKTIKEKDFELGKSDILKGQLNELANQFTTDQKTKGEQITNLISKVKEIETNFTSQVSTLSDSLINFSNDSYTKEEAKVALEKANEAMDFMRKDILSRMPHGGGNANRQMFVGGADPLTKYTDVNFKAGSNVTLTYSNNNATKKVDIVISSSGGGGGSVRSINSISGDTSAGSTSGTDYVYLCTGTLTLTLPDASANTNLYTVKNVGTGIITIATTSSQTIDGSTTITMPVQYTSVDLISDTAGWNVT